MRMIQQDIDPKLRIALEQADKNLTDGVMIAKTLHVFADFMDSLTSQQRTEICKDIV